MVRVRIKCRHCGFETEIEVNPCPMIGMPGKKAKGLKLKYSKEDLDKIMEHSHGASLEDLQQLGLDISSIDFLDAEERFKIKEFIRKNLKISKELKRTAGEMVKLGTDDWKMGDKFSEIDLPASEVASLGDDDLRLIPGLTMKKSTYIEAPGHETETLRGVKFVSLLDVSGSMFDEGAIKVKKALTICEESWRICKKLDFQYFLCCFSDTSKIVPRESQQQFFEDLKYRAGYMFAGGTCLSSGLKVFSDDIYKDSNLLIISDMDIGDISSTIDRLTEIAKITNSFKIVLVESKGKSIPEYEARVKSWFPDQNVEILAFEV